MLGAHRDHLAREVRREVAGEEHDHVGDLGGLGRAPEGLALGEVVEQATQLARNMVTRWGMSDALGMVQLAPRENPYLGNVYAGDKPFSEETARRIDAEVQRILDESHEQAKSLLRQHRKELDALVDALLAHETLDEKQVLEVTGLPPARTLETAPVVAAGADRGRRTPRA